MPRAWLDGYRGPLNWEDVFVRLRSVTGYAVVSKWDEGEDLLLLGSCLSVAISIIRSMLSGNGVSSRLLRRLRLGLELSFGRLDSAAEGLSGDWVLLNCGGGVKCKESEGRWPFVGASDKSREPWKRYWVFRL